MRIDAELIPGHVKSWTTRFGRECAFVDALPLLCEGVAVYEEEQREFILQVARLARSAMDSKEIMQASAPAQAGKSQEAQPVRRRAKSL